MTNAVLLLNVAVLLPNVTVQLDNVLLRLLIDMLLPMLNDVMLRLLRLLLNDVLLRLLLNDVLLRLLLNNMLLRLLLNNVLLRLLLRPPPPILLLLLLTLGLPSLLMITAKQVLLHKFCNVKLVEKNLLQRLHSRSNGGALSPTTFGVSSVGVRIKTR